MTVNPMHFLLFGTGTLSRKTVIFILLILTVGLATLGLRLPSATGVSSSTAKPKPRPRAVIQNQIKTCKQIVSSLADAITFIPERDFIIDPPQSGCNLKVRLIGIKLFTLVPVQSSRAPPAISFLF